MWTGTEGWLTVQGWNGKLEASSPGILGSEIKPEEVHLSTDVSEHANFLKCIRSREERDPWKMEKLIVDS
jgi:hypothetical protein